LVISQEFVRELELIETVTVGPILSTYARGGESPSMGHEEL